MYLKMIKNADGTETFVPGKVVETKNGPKFVSGQVIQTAEGEKFLPGVVVKDPEKEGGKVHQHPTITDRSLNDPHAENVSLGCVKNAVAPIFSFT